VGIGGDLMFDVLVEVGFALECLSGCEYGYWSACFKVVWPFS